MSVPHRATVAVLATVFIPVTAAIGQAVPAHATVVACQGVKATIVGTSHSETIHGTQKPAHQIRRISVAMSSPPNPVPERFLRAPPDCRA